MSAAPFAALIDIRVRAIDQVPTEKTKMRARARQSGTPALRSVTDVSMVENGPAQHAPQRSADINMVRYGIASQSTAQK
jgi:pilus assembly protein CpaB